MHAIIGAGIGGLTTALAFQKLDLPYNIYERADELSEVGAGIWLAPNALRVIDWLGLLEEVGSLGSKVNSMTLSDHKMQDISFSSQESSVQKYGFSTIAIHRAKLQKLLFDQIPSEKIHLGHAFQSFEKQQNGSVQVSFKNADPVIATSIIGADGIHSSVRKLLFSESQTRYTGQTCWRGISNFELDKNFKHAAYEMWGDQVRFGFSGISKTKVYWFAVAKERRNGKDDLSELESKLEKTYASFHPLVQQIIGQTPIDQILRNDIIDLKPMPNWYYQNICLVGDAAHATTPNMGQGGAQAIEDAYHLAQTMESQQSVEAAFELFQKNRQAKVNSIVNRSWMVGKMAHWSYFQGLRNMLMRSLPSKTMDKQLAKIYEL